MKDKLKIKNECLPSLNLAFSAVLDLFWLPNNAGISLPHTQKGTSVFIQQPGQLDGFPYTRCRFHHPTDVIELSSYDRIFVLLYFNSKVKYKYRTNTKFAGNNSRLLILYNLKRPSSIYQLLLSKAISGKCQVRSATFTWTDHADAKLSVDPNWYLSRYSLF